MPRKPIAPHQQPVASKEDHLKSFAAILASGAVRAAGNGDNHDLVEPVVNLLYVDKETSVKHSKNEVLLKIGVNDAVPSQPSLFDDVK